VRLAILSDLHIEFELFGDFRADSIRAADAMTDYRRNRLSPSFRTLRTSDTALVRSWSGRRPTAPVLARGPAGE